MGRLEVLEYLEENNIVTQHPVEFIVFSNEEGALLGLRALAGELDQDGIIGPKSMGKTDIKKRSDSIQKNKHN